jgi:uncharacterized protein (TIRG00374 family)
MSKLFSFDRSKIKPLLISLFFTLLLVGLLAYSISWGEVYEQLKKVSYWYLIPGTIVVYIQMIARTMRWRILLSPQSNTSFAARFGSLMVGNFATFVLPLRAGEFLRPLYLSKQSTVSFVECFVSVVLERFFDLATVLLLFVAGTYLLPELPVEAKVGASSLLVPALGILIVALCGALCPDVVRSCSDFFLRFFPEKLRSILIKMREDFIAGSKVLASFKNWLLLLVWCAIVWGLTIYGYEVMLGLVMPGAQWSLALALTVISAFAVALPSMPGFIGVFQWACIGSFLLFDLPKEQAVTFSIVVHIHQYLVNILTGGIVLLIDMVRSKKTPLVSP